MILFQSKKQIIQM